MGTWGANNFDSDSASDFFKDEVLRPLLGHIGRIMADPGAMELDEEGEFVLMPCIDVLTTLITAYPILSKDIIGPSKDIAGPETVHQWRDIYLAAYDDYIDNLDPAPGFKEERRQVIADTFDRLEEAIRRVQNS